MRKAKILLNLHNWIMYCNEMKEIERLAGNKKEQEKWFNAQMKAQKVLIEKTLDWVK